MDLIGLNERREKTMSESKLPELVRQEAKSDYSQVQVEIIKNQICKGFDDNELKFFMQVCNRTKLDPFARQIYAVPRWDKKVNKNVMSIQTSIDGFRLIAERSKQYAGQVGPFWCGPDGEWKDVWLGKGQPVAAKIGVLRHDFKETLWAVARFDAYKQSFPDGNLSGMWAKMGDVMVAKCCEALALRKAFPQDLSGLYTADEMEQVVHPPTAQDGHTEALSSTRNVSPEPPFDPPTPADRSANPIKKAQPQAAPPPPPKPAGPTYFQLIMANAQKKEITSDELGAYIKAVYGVQKARELNQDQVRDLHKLMADDQTDVKLLKYLSDPDAHDQNEASPEVLDDELNFLR